jgi:hypothetical protein
MLAPVPVPHTCTCTHSACLPPAPPLIPHTCSTHLNPCPFSTPATCTPFYSAHLHPHLHLLGTHVTHTPFYSRPCTCTHACSTHLPPMPFCSACLHAPAPITPLLFCTPAPIAIEHCKTLTQIFTMKFLVVGYPTFLWAPPLSPFLWWTAPPTVAGYPTVPGGRPTVPFLMVGR